MTDQCDTGFLLASARRFLEEGRYEQAAAFVGRVRAAPGNGRASGLSEMLVDAHRLCLACAHHRAEAESQRRAARISAGLERRLHERLRGVLEAMTVAPVPAAAPPGPAAAAGSARGVLSVQCLGHFAVRDGDRTLGPWPNRRAKAVFKFLVLHRGRPVRKEVLMDTFWPDAEANAARNSLNVAIHSLRRFLREEHADVSHVVFQDGSYTLDPHLPLWIDVEEWERLVASGRALDRAGRTSEAIAELRAAEALYGGGLFEDDPYEEWALPRRRELHDSYVGVLERLRDHHFSEHDYDGCAAVAREILAVEPTSEDTHRVLMRCYARQGHHHLAMRQYGDCEHTLRRVLGSAPDPATRRLHERVRRHAPV